jgi:hypothetical protein
LAKNNFPIWPPFVEDAAKSGKLFTWSSWKSGGACRAWAGKQSNLKSERPLHNSQIVCALGRLAMRHDPTEIVEARGVGPHDDSSNVDFVFGELFIPTGVRIGV